MKFEHVIDIYTRKIEINRTSADIMLIYYTVDDGTTLVDKWERDNYKEWHCIGTRCET